jgi:hypothetical protein
MEELEKGIASRPTTKENRGNQQKEPSILRPKSGFLQKREVFFIFSLTT